MLNLQDQKITDQKFSITGKCMTWKMTGQEPDVGLCPESGVYSAIGFGADFEEASASAFHEVFGEVNISECWFTDIVRCLLGLPSRLVTDSGVARRSRRGGVCRSQSCRWRPLTHGSAYSQDSCVGAHRVKYS